MTIHGIICKRDRMIVDEVSDIWDECHVPKDFEKASLKFYRELCIILEKFFPHILFALGFSDPDMKDSFGSGLRFNLIVIKALPITDGDDIFPKKPPFFVGFANMDISDHEHFCKFLRSEALKAPMFEEINGLLTDGKVYYLCTIDYSSNSNCVLTRTINLRFASYQKVEVLEWIIDKLVKEYRSIPRTYYLHPKDGGSFKVSLQTVLCKETTSSVFSVAMQHHSEDFCAIKIVYGEDKEFLVNELELYDTLNHCGLSCVLQLKGYITLSDYPFSKKVGIALQKGTPVTKDTLKDGDISYEDFHQSFLELIDGLSKIHTEAKILHRSIVPKNLLLMDDKQSQSKKLVFIDWGHSVRFDGVEYCGPHAGNTTTASESVMQQLYSSTVTFRPADDLEALMKTYFLLLDGEDLKSISYAELFIFWKNHGPFQSMKANLQDDISNAEKLKNYLTLLKNTKV